MNYVQYNCKNLVSPDTHFVDSVDISNWSTKIPHPKNVLILVHGVKGKMEDVSPAYEGIRKKLEYYQVKYDLVVEFYWPSSFMFSVGYITAKLRSKRAAKFLEDCIRKVVELYSPYQITIQGHSLGCYVIQQTTFVDMMIKSYKGTKLKYIYCAPAIKNSYMETHVNSYPEDVKRPIHNNMIVAYSRNDHVLKFLFRLMPENLFSPALGYEPSKVLKRNLCTFHDYSGISMSHSDYKNIPNYYKITLSP